MNMFKNDLYKEQSAFLNVAAAGADATVVAAPTGGQYIVVDSYVVSTAGVGQVFLESGTTTQISVRHETVAGSNVVVTDCRLVCAAATLLSVTSVGAGIGAHSVQVNYHIEGV